MDDILNTYQDDKELQVLQSISIRDKVRQRDMAAVAGLSLGMTNAIVKRLITKGLLTVRKINNRRILYAVSPEGMEEIARRSYRYFKRTVKNIVYYKNSIDVLIRGLKDAGFSAVSLIGPSDVDFIVEHLCGRYGIAYGQQEDDCDIKAGSFVLYGEKWAKVKNPDAGGRAAGRLRDILVHI
jgi:DNA-binding MarR family transcriptional regulator